MASCKQKDSLIIVAVTADSMASDVTSLTLAVSGTTQVFPLHSGLSDTATTFGLYVPSDVIGTVKVTATASRGTCLAIRGRRVRLRQDPPLHELSRRSVAYGSRAVTSARV